MDMSMMSPERVALEYDGNKQKIAAAAQSGLLNPTVAVMAGMFIDRMRAAATQEQAAPTTVEQDVLGAPQAPAGLGATPQAQQLQQGQERAMQAIPPSQAGVAALPVDERMIPGGEGYAGGGIVAFANRGEVDLGGDDDTNDLDLSTVEGVLELERRRQAQLAAARDAAAAKEEAIAAVRPTAPAVSRVLGAETQGAPSTSPVPSIKSGKQYTMEDLIGAATERRNLPLSEGELAAQEYYKSAATRAAEAKSRGFNEFLTEMGFRAAASKSPRALQAFGEAGAGATPRLTAAGKEARELEEAGIKGMAELGRTERLQKLAGIAAGEKAFHEQETLASAERRANMPPDVIRAAMAIQKPGESLDSALSRYTEATNKADKYNAISNRHNAAMKAMYESSSYDKLSRAYSNAKTDADREKIDGEIEKLRQKFLRAGDVSPGDVAFMNSFTSKYGAKPEAGEPKPAAPTAPKAAAPAANAKVTMTKADIDRTLQVQKVANPKITREDIIKRAKELGYNVVDK